MRMCVSKIKNVSFSDNFAYILNGQKQPPEVFCKKRCSEKVRKIHRKTPEEESFFNKVAGLRNTSDGYFWNIFGSVT